MRFAYAIVFLLLSYLGRSTAWFGGGGDSDSGSSSSGNSNDLSGSATVEAGDDGVKGTVSVEHQGDGWGGRVDVSVDDEGNVEGGASVNVDFKKRSISWNGEHFNIHLHVDHCNFRLYDHDRDGVITMREWKKIFGNDANAVQLYAALDMNSEDGTIDEAEFYTTAPVLIRGCENILK